MLEVLIDLAAAQGRGLDLLSYREDEQGRPQGLPAWAGFRGLRYAKLGLIREMLRRFSRRTLYLFDYLRLARPLLPLMLSGQARVLIFAHGWDYWKRLKRIDARILREATLCLTNSRFTLAKMQERLPGFEGQVCLLGLSPRIALNQAIPADPGPPMHLEAADGQHRRIGEQMLLLTARMEPGERHKGHYPLLEAWPLLSRQHPGVQMIFAGPGGDRENIRRRAVERGAAGSVFLTGHVSPELLSRLYRRCHAFVMPSLQEGFGLVYLEAMNYARPCVGCWDQGAEDVIVPGETGFLIHDPWDREELVARLGRLLDQPELAREMGIRGFRRLHENFTNRHFKERFRGHLERIL